MLSCICARPPVSAAVRMCVPARVQARYNVLFNNCEHFAYWCTLDRSVSNQVSVRMCMRRLCLHVPHVLHVLYALHVLHACVSDTL